MKKFSKIVMGVIAATLVLAFFAVPVIKLHEIDMGIVIMIGVVLMIVNIVEVIREKDD